MAKKPQTPDDSEGQQRQSRKDILIARKHERQLRNIRIATIVVLVLIGIVIAIALIDIPFLAPNRAVASVGDQTITLRDWQNRVEYERAQRIIFLENQLQAFGGDVGIVQQFGGSVMNELLDREGLGQNVLNVMAEELVICNAVAERGIEITDADVQARIEQNYNFFGEGVSPTPLPEPTQTIQPTPSLTPIPTAVITEVVPVDTPFPTATADPAATSAPTATPVSEAAFQEQHGELMAQLGDLGVDETTYRAAVRSQLCREKLTEALATEQNLSTTAPHASLFLIAANTEEAANETQALLEAEEFLTVWNTILSRPEDPEATEAPETSSFELIWRTQDSLESSLGADLASAAFTLDVNEPSDIITVDNGDGTSTYYIIMVSGREERELSETELDAKRDELVQVFVDEQLTGNLQLNDLWRSHVPSLPALPNKFLAQPTATPEVAPTAEVVLPTAAPESEE
jgi:hypothetical protein